MVERAELPPGTTRVPPSRARDFARELLEAAHVPAEHAALVADVLVRADLRGIRSHGVARLPYFLLRIENDTINTRPNLTYRSRTPSTGTLEADQAIGIVAADRAMAEALAMAAGVGSGFVAVTNSSHFGYAGYWAERAMQHGCIGISLSNSGRRAAPTFGTESVLGTNPLSVTIPGGGTDFFLDMATTAVAVGKIETALREERPIPTGWTAGAAPPPQLDENGVLDYSAPLLPLGGDGDATGGHKGYGLSLMAELLCGAIAGSTLQERIDGADGSAPPAMGHFMGAIRLDGFDERKAIGARMETTFDRIRSAQRAPGHDRIYIHGEPELIAERDNERHGIPVTPRMGSALDSWSDRLGVDRL